MKCLMMMNKLGVSLWEAEQWALSYDLNEMEVRYILRSCYSHTAEHGVYELPLRRFTPSTPTKSCKVAKVVAPFFSHTRVRAKKRNEYLCPNRLCYPATNDPVSSSR